MTLFVTDRLLGHTPVGADGKREPNKFSNPDMNSPDTQRELAQKMERYIFDPRFSLNPVCTPYTLSGKDSLRLIEFSEQVIRNDTTEKTLKLNLETAEPGEPIDVFIPKDTQHELQGFSSPKSWENIQRTVIGDTTLPKRGRNSR